MHWYKGVVSVCVCVAWVMLWAWNQLQAFVHRDQFDNIKQVKEPKRCMNRLQCLFSALVHKTYSADEHAQPSQHSRGYSQPDIYKYHHHQVQHFPPEVHSSQPHASARFSLRTMDGGEIVGLWTTLFEGVVSRSLRMQCLQKNRGAQGYHDLGSWW